MRIVSNRKLIRRNARIGYWASIIGLIFLVAAVALSFLYEALLGPSLILMAFGFLISQIGIYYGNRYGRSPRPDELIEGVLKGLDQNYTLYNYASPVAHLLVGPAGVWALLPKNVKGAISYDERRRRWLQKGGNLYLKVFAQEGIGRPDIELNVDSETLRKFLNKVWENGEPPEVNAALILTYPDTVAVAENAPYPTLPGVKVKDFLRKAAKEKRFPDGQIEKVNALFTFVEQDAADPAKS